MFPLHRSPCNTLGLMSPATSSKNASRLSHNVPPSSFSRRSPGLVNRGSNRVTVTPADHTQGRLSGSVQYLQVHPNSRNCAASKPARGLRLILSPSSLTPSVVPGHCMCSKTGLMLRQRSQVWHYQRDRRDRDIPLPSCCVTPLVTSCCHPRSHFSKRRDSSKWSASCCVTGHTCHDRLHRT
jgi:hypothetical protein